MCFVYVSVQRFLIFRRLLCISISICALHNQLFLMIFYFLHTRFALSSVHLYSIITFYFVSIFSSSSLSLIFICCSRSLLVQLFIVCYCWDLRALKLLCFLSDTFIQYGFLIEIYIHSSFRLRNLFSLAFHLLKIKIWSRIISSSICGMSTTRKYLLFQFTIY